MGQAAENAMVVKQDFEVVAEVRRFVRLVSGQWGMDDFAPCLVASELVTNARAPRGALLYPRRSREELKGGSWA